jgi:hypothetical protein
MSLTFEALLVALVAILPGFLAISINATIRGKPKPTGGQLVGHSLVASAVFNAVALAVVLLLDFPLVEPETAASELPGGLAQLPLTHVLLYLFCLYGLALLVGAAIGLGHESYPLRMLRRLRMLSDDPQMPLIHEIVNTSIDGAEQVLWVRLRRGERDLIGIPARLRHPGDAKEASELFLAPAYERIEHDFERLRVPGGASSMGVHVRVMPEDVLEIFRAPKAWVPQAPA